ncbi:MAG: DUF3549 family protein [Gammaproteobacteria bacterium]|nr:DUF3549 family protein [Gammaproteobacteria bacterium]
MTDTDILPQTLCEFLSQTGAQIQFYDIGRRVVEITHDDMLAIEHQQRPYPQPFLRHAWLGVLFHYDDDNNDAEAKPASDSHQIWFLKFPLDEQGLLSQDARNDFLRRIIETLAEQTLAQHNARLAATAGDSAKPTAPDMPEDNPHGFTPRDDRMASFHAKIARKLGLGSSQYYSHAADYFTGRTGFEQWNFVGLQGIADVAARLDEGDNLNTLIKAIPQLPITPFAALCSCLENEAIAPPLSAALRLRLAHDLQHDEAVAATGVAAALRGLSHGQDQQALDDALRATLCSTPASDIGRHVEVLATIAGRAWHRLEQADIARAFLLNLARCDAGQTAFDNIMADLMFIPGLRKPLLDALRRLREDNECSSQEAAIIDRFFQSLQL